MNQPFQVPQENIQSALAILYPLVYTVEYLQSIQWNSEMADNIDRFDLSIAYNLLGGYMPSQADHKDIN